MSDDLNRRGSRWLKPLLMASLAANLLIVGIVAGSFFSAGGERPDRVSREVSNLVGPQFFRALEPEDRRALVRDIAQKRDRIRENRGALRRRIEQLLVELNSEPFDVDAVKMLLEEQRSAVAGRHQFGEELLLERLSSMSAEERAAFADRLAASLKRLRRD